MTYFSQKDPRWANLEYYPGCTFKQYGCFVCSLSMLCDKEPPETAKLLRDNGCFDGNGNIINKDKVTELLGLEYNGISQTQPDYDCICETTYFDKASTNAIEQHFFVLTKDGEILDPLGLNINYPIKSYRLFKGKDMTQDELKAIISNVVNGFYINYYLRTPGGIELNNHINSILSDYNARKLANNHPEWALSEWVNRQKNEAEFKKNWAKPIVCKPCPAPVICPPPVVCPASADDLIKAIRKLV